MQSSSPRLLAIRSPKSDGRARSGAGFSVRALLEASDGRGVTRFVRDGLDIALMSGQPTRLPQKTVVFRLPPAHFAAAPGILVRTACGQFF